jgi:hypothetical protein
MKVQFGLLTCIFAFLFAIIPSKNTKGQQYKLKQSTSMSGMKSETTIYVKGSRKRTEGGGYMGMGANLVTIEQCDLQRTIKINDKKKLYFIDPFVKELEEDNEKESKSSSKTKPTPAATKDKPVKGGTIYMYYNITDTGERKKMYGFTARRIWTTQKMKPSADACMMKDSMIIKTDGWYIDLPQFNCPVTGVNRSSYQASTQKIECQDKFVSKRSGKGKLGFPLIETKTMIMGGMTTTSEFTTSLETLELTTVKLDSMLFEIPSGYQETKNEEDLQEKMSISDLMKQGGYDKTLAEKSIPTGQKKTGTTRIAVFKPTGDETVDAAGLQRHVVNMLMTGNVEAVSVSSLEEAKTKQCDLVLNTEVSKIKQASKVGSLLKAIKNTDPTATSSYNIEGNLKLTTIEGALKDTQKVSGKFDGKPEEAVRRAMEKGCGEIIKNLR